MAETSQQYAIRCAEIIKADKNVSEDTIIIMFIEYGNLLMQEKLGKQPR